MAILNVNTAENQLNFPKDAIICQKYIAGIPGGRALDAADYPVSVIYAGTPVIKKDGAYKPFPIVLASEQLPKAALTEQTAGSALVGTVYEEVAATATGAVKCAFEDGTIIYLDGDAATGNAVSGHKYYSKDTEHKVTVYLKDENGNTYYVLGTLPANWNYAGILYKSIKKTVPAAAIMTEGQVNIAALYYDMSSILSAFKAACPLIEFIQDEQATA